MPLVLLPLLAAGVVYGDALEGYGIVGEGLCAGEDQLPVHGLLFANKTVTECAQTGKRVFKDMCTGFTVFWDAQETLLNCVVHGRPEHHRWNLCEWSKACEPWPSNNGNFSTDDTPSAVIPSGSSSAMCYSSGSGSVCTSEQGQHCILPLDAGSFMWTECMDRSSGGAYCPTAYATNNDGEPVLAAHGRCSCRPLRLSFTETLPVGSSDGSMVLPYVLCSVLLLVAVVMCALLYKLYTARKANESKSLKNGAPDEELNTLEDLGELLKNNNSNNNSNKRSTPTSKEALSLLLWSNVTGTDNPLKKETLPTCSSISTNTDSKGTGNTSKQSKASHEKPNEITLSPSHPSALHTIKESDLLGVGAFGSVYKALGDTGELLAVKRIRMVPGINIEGARKEYKLMSEFAHPNIVAVRDFVSDASGDTVRIIMEFLAGGSIMTLLHEFGALPKKTVINYTNQILNGLQHLHNNNIIHSDIKPANILVHSTGDVKLTDFGLSRFAMQSTAQTLDPEMPTFNKPHGVNSLTNSTLKSVRVITTLGTGTLEGTIPYMSPNVVRYLQYTSQSDIWAVGCTVCEMLTGTAPWMGKKRTEEDILLCIGEGKRPDADLTFPRDDPTVLEFLDKCFQAEGTKDTAGDLLGHSFFTHTYQPPSILDVRPRL